MSLGKRIILNEKNIEINGRANVPNLTKHFSGLPWIQRLSISPDGRTLAFSGDDQNQYVMATMDIAKIKLKSQSDTIYDYFFGPAVFSPNSRTIAYVARKNNEIFVVKGEEELMHFPADGFYISDLVFSPDSKAFAYVLENRLAATVHVVAEDGTGEGYDSISDVIFSPDHSQLVYIASKWDRIHIVVNDKEVQTFSLEELFMPTLISFSPSNNQLAYVMTAPDESMIFFDGAQISEKFNSISNLTFSRDGKKLLFGATRTNDLGEVEIIAGEILL